MQKPEAQEYAGRWIQEQQFLRIPLFYVSDDDITTIPHLSGVKPRLSCSNELRRHLKGINLQIESDWARSKSIEGLIYTVYRFSKDERIELLYIGIARCAGRKGELSILFKHDMNRFHHGDMTNGHVDKISRTIRGEINSYSNWVAALFNNGIHLNRPTPSAVLRTPTYVHFEIWSSNAHSIIPPFRSIDQEEMNRVAIFGTNGVGHHLLNTRGNK
jgi:hypothetical protein